MSQFQVLCSISFGGNWRFVSGRRCTSSTEYNVGKQVQLCHLLIFKLRRMRVALSPSFVIRSFWIPLSLTFCHCRASLEHINLEELVRPSTDLLSYERTGIPLSCNSCPCQRSDHVRSSCLGEPGRSIKLFPRGGVAGQEAAPVNGLNGKLS